MTHLVHGCESLGHLAQEGDGTLIGHRRHKAADHLSSIANTEACRLASRAFHKAR